MPSTTAQCTTAAWQGLVPTSAPPREPEPLCGSSMRLCAHLSGTQRLNQKRSMELCVGGIFMTTSLTNLLQFRRTQPESSVIQSGLWLLTPLWLSEKTMVQRFKGWKCQRLNRRDPWLNQCSAWVKGLRVAVNVRVGVILHTRLLQH